MGFHIQMGGNRINPHRRRAFRQHFLLFITHERPFVTDSKMQ
jgi:hypothetical protein